MSALGPRRGLLPANWKVAADTAQRQTGARSSLRLVLGTPIVNYVVATRSGGNRLPQRSQKRPQHRSLRVR